MSAVSFKFSKTNKNVKLDLEGSKFKEETQKYQKDFILSIENKKIKGSIVKEKKEYVIPLNTSKISELEQEAIKCILNDTQQFISEETVSKDSDEVIQISNSTITNQNQPFSIPKASTIIPDYDVVPIEHYGIAILKGMGWKPGDPIGLNSKRIVSPIDPVLRPKGMGLGAEKILKIKEFTPTDIKNSNIKEEDKIKGYSIGSTVKILKGSPYNDLYGKIDGSDEDNGRLIINLTDGLIVSIPKFLIKPVSLKEYNIFMEEKRSEEVKVRPDKSPKQYGLINMKFKKENTKLDEVISIPTNYNGWVKPRLKVRIIDKKYHQGRFYQKKALVTKIKQKSGEIFFYAEIFDENSRSSITIKDLQEYMVETVIPKTIKTLNDKDSPPMIVMVVKGDFKNQIGELIEKDKLKSKGKVKLTDKYGKPFIKDFSYDHICQYL